MPGLAWVRVWVRVGGRSQSTSVAATEGRAFKRRKCPSNWKKVAPRRSRLETHTLSEMNGTAPMSVVYE